MTGTSWLVGLTLLLTAVAFVEMALHRRNLASIRVRIHVNGTRGKSSVTRLIAAALREAGMVTCAKTTGTLARFILPDGREVPIFRPAGANVIEQRRIVAAAAAEGAEALVIECMALQPELQALSERHLIRATHTVITNARPDHLDVMGPGPEDVARALAGVTPRGGKLYTAEVDHLQVFVQAARDRGAELRAVGREEIEAVTAAELAGFSYREHPDNVALALAVLADLGVPREVAVRGMQRARPDPGALTEHALHFFGRDIRFVNAFAANDPVSTAQLWHQSIERHGPERRRLAVFNCRADRPDRSFQLGSEYPRWTGADHVVLMGTGTHLFLARAIASGAEPGSFHVMEGLRVDEIFERLVELAGAYALIVGMGNVGGQGLDLVRCFANRAAPTRPEEAP